MKKIVRAAGISFLLILFLSLSLRDKKGKPYIIPQGAEKTSVIQSNPKKYHVTTKVIISNAGYSLSKLAVVLPYPQTNQYQDISNYSFNGAQILSAGDDHYLRFSLTDKVPVPGEKKEFTVEYDATVYDVSSPVLKEPVPSLLPLKNKQPFYEYLGESGSQINLSNPVIISNGNRIWKETGGNLFQYAKKCYEYVARSYKYCNPNTGLYPLHSLMSNGGGDCGNLSSIFISLLRYKDIPARHLIGAVAEAGFHVWSDFYLENYGWIPVDVTFKNGDPKHEFFGQLTSDHRIIFNRNINRIYSKEPGANYQNALLQDYHWWIWGEGDAGKITSEYKISITPV